LTSIVAARAAAPADLGESDTAVIGSKPTTRVEALLAFLSSKYGIDMSYEDEEALINDPPSDPDTFVDAVLIGVFGAISGSGWDPALSEWRPSVSEAVRDWIFDEGRGSGSKSGLPLLRPTSDRSSA
jgi:hypothetical protein